MKILFYTHGGSGNHGCEAILRTGIQLVKNIDNSAVITVLSYRPEEDRKYIKDINANIIAYPHYSKTSPFRIIYSGLNRLNIKRQEWYNTLTNSVIKKNVDEQTIAISIGGDNYCYGAPYAIYSANRILKGKKCKTILLGVSIDPERITEEMLKDLRGYNLIHVRESISYQALKEKDLNNICLYPDTAFMLETVECKDSFFFGNQEVIGVNYSPLVINKAEKGCVENNFRKCVKWILDNTNNKIAFIPHVEWNGNDDYVAMKSLYEEFAGSGRVKLFKCDDCRIQKGIIKRCDFLIAARTHASIAAYSNCIPTLVVGYSVKARGIAKDLFGEYEKYVLDASMMTVDDSLLEKFKELYLGRNQIKSYLEKVIPGYKKRLLELEIRLKGLITEDE